MPAESAPGNLNRARSLLEQDRVWGAYSLADLEPPFSTKTSWQVGDRALVMIYAGLEPPLLFAHGEPQEVAELLAKVPPGDYQYGLLATHRAGLGSRLHPTRETQMWRMVLRPDGFPHDRAHGAEPLGTGDLPALLHLFDKHADRPDSFGAAQLPGGAFFGIREDGELVAAAGTHVIGTKAGVAAVGNVFTHPAHRRRGFGGRVSRAVVEELLRREIPTIVLNVAMDNAAALGLYRGLGFMPFCGYYEGVGELAAE